MKKNKKLFTSIILFLFVFCTSINAFASDLSQAEINKLDKYIETQMKDGEIPGVSIVIIKGDSTVYKKAFGYSDVKEGKTASSETLFELGSTSKAFTGLAILKLEKEGRISLNDPIEKYLPWLKMKYEGKDVSITIEQFLHHTSGVPYDSIDKIPQSESEIALEECVRTLVGQELQSKPGEKFSYATINYDVLGLIVKQISGQSFEEYMKKNILEPMGLSNTYLFREEAKLKDMSKGYKIGFLKAQEYAAPMYRGNTPAGYIITNIEDFTRWMRIQMLTVPVPEGFEEIIKKSHMPDRSVAPVGDGSSYAAGWQVFQQGEGEIAHGGGNPNFTSYMIFRPDQQMGVAVLTNVSGNDITEVIGHGIMDILQDRTIYETTSSLVSVDRTASLVFLLTLILKSISSNSSCSIISKVSLEQSYPYIKRECLQCPF